MKFKLVSINSQQKQKLISAKLEREFGSNLGTWLDSSNTLKFLIDTYSTKDIVKVLCIYYIKSNPHLKRKILLNLNSIFKETELLNKEPYLLVLFLRNLFSRKSSKASFYYFINDLNLLVKSNTEYSKTFLMSILLQIAHVEDFRKSTSLISEIVQTIAPEPEFMSRLKKIAKEPSLKLLNTYIHDFMRYVIDIK